MKVDDELILRLERLSRLSLDATTRMQVKKDLSSMLDMVSKLAEADVDQVSPLIYLSEQKDPLRDDKIDKPMDRDRALRDAPSLDGPFIKVPRVLPDPT